MVRGRPRGGKKRKSPIRHTVRAHKRKGYPVKSFPRGSGRHQSTRSRGVRRRVTINPQRGLRQKAVGKFGEQELFKLPTHNVMVVTGLAQEGEPKSRIIARVATESPSEAVRIANVVLREEFDFATDLYDVDVFNTPTEARLKSVSWRPEDVPDMQPMDKAFFNVVHEKPLYYKSETDEIKEFWQDISYAG